MTASSAVAEITRRLKYADQSDHTTIDSSESLLRRYMVDYSALRDRPPASISSFRYVLRLLIESVHQLGHLLRT